MRRPGPKLDVAWVRRELAAQDLEIVNDERNEPDERLEAIIAKAGLTRPLTVEALDALSEDALDGLCAACEELHDEGVAGALALAGACRRLLGDPVTVPSWALPSTVLDALAITASPIRFLRFEADGVAEVRHGEAGWELVE